MQRVAQRRTPPHLSLLLGCLALGEGLAQLLGTLLGRLPQAPFFERTHLRREAIKRTSEVIRGHQWSTRRLERTHLEGTRLRHQGCMRGLLLEPLVLPPLLLAPLLVAHLGIGFARTRQPVGLRLRRLSKGRARRKAAHLGRSGPISADLGQRRRGGARGP